MGNGGLDSAGIDAIPSGIDAIPAGIDAIPAGIDAIPAGIDAIPAQFDVTIPLVKMWQDGKGGLRFEGVAASTSLDRQDERLTLAAIEKMEQYCGIDLLPSHGSGVLEELGVVEKCWLDNAQFRIAGSLDASNPEAVRLYERLKAGKQYGLSVGGRVLSAHREFDAEAGKHVKYIDDVELDHVAVCRPSSAANPDTYLTVLAKAANAVLAEEPASDGPTMRPAPFEIEADGNVVPTEDALFARLGKSIAEICQKMWAFGASRSCADDGNTEPKEAEDGAGSSITGPAWHSTREARTVLRQAPPLRQDGEGEGLDRNAAGGGAEEVFEAPPLWQDGEGEGLERNAAGDEAASAVADSTPHAMSKDGSEPEAEEVFGPDDAGWQDAMLGELHRQVESLSQAVDELKKDVEADEQAQQVVPGQPQAIPGQTRLTRDKQVMWKGVL